LFTFKIISPGRIQCRKLPPGVFALQALSCAACNFPVGNPYGFQNNPVWFFPANALFGLTIQPGTSIIPDHRREAAVAGHASDGDGPVVLDKGWTAFTVTCMSGLRCTYVSVCTGNFKLFRKKNNFCLNNHNPVALARYYF
jgi:hypothetical protein